LDAFEKIVGSIKNISYPKTDWSKKNVVLLIVDLSSQTKPQIKEAGLQIGFLYIFSYLRTT
jgi:hypothetical protein